MEKGGATGFPTLGVRVHPVEGSAVAWYNLNSDGTINYDLLHGGCPVLYGTKWSEHICVISQSCSFYNYLIVCKLICSC